MNVNYELDKDGCLDVELVKNSVDWHKEEGGDNILLQYINGGENMRIIERFSSDKNIVEAHHWKKGLAVKFSDGSKKSYYQDEMGNYKSLAKLNQRSNKLEKKAEENRQNTEVHHKNKSRVNVINQEMLRFLNNRAY